MKCPKCHRDTYSKKWGTCTACYPPADGVGAVVSCPAPVTLRVTEPPEVTQKVTEPQQVTATVAPAVTPKVSAMARAGSYGYAPGPGDECPTCGRKVPMSHAQRQAAYRQARADARPSGRLGRGRKA